MDTNVVRDLLFQHNTVHELKVWPQFMDVIQDGTKTFEARKNDRYFQVGDLLYLREWCPEQKAFLRRWRIVEVTYLLKGPGFGVEEGYVVMGFRRLL